MRLFATILVAVVGTVGFVGSASAQSGVADDAFYTCIGPGPPGVDPQQVLDNFHLMVSQYSRNQCLKACKGLGSACKNVARAQEKCGITFIKNVSKLAKVICQAEGGTKGQCKTINSVTKVDLADWKTIAALEKGQCEFEHSACALICPVR